ncbi:MAG: PEGA domain-containing protein [Treponema sp.]|jgi:hypothetical protein|nr:PEGA domain-containing protein [Treponema sp.]
MIKLRFVFTLVFLCIFPSLVTGRNVNDIIGDNFEEVTGTGLEVHTNPLGVRVFIDGVYHGLTPFILDNIGAGPYNIRLTKEGYRDRNLRVILYSTSRLIVSIEMPELRGNAQVSVLKAEGSPESLPFNPQIHTSRPSTQSVLNTHDGLSLTNNQANLNLPIGYNTIRVRAFGWEDASINLMVDQFFTVNAEVTMVPAAFRIGNATQSRRRFNPLNSNNLGLTEYRFEVSAPGTGTITILNNKDEIVFRRNIGVFNTWLQQITWNGRDSSGNPLPQGIYTVLIETSPMAAMQEDDQNETETSLRLETEINYSAAIIPLSVDSGISGLLLTPMPHVLAQGSFQFDAGFFVGNFLLPQKINESGVFGFPFLINMRVTPLEKLELNTSFNINSYPNKQTSSGFSGSAKYQIIDGSDIPLYLAAGISYAWAGYNGDSPLSPGRGFGLHSPLSYELTNLSIVFCPALFWHGPEGLTPALLLSTGVLYRDNWYNAGLSARCEIDFRENAESPKFLTGAELHLFPPPSNLVFSLLGGVWVQGKRLGGYGGLRIGIIN